MSVHIGAKPGDVAPFVLMPGDPMRAKHFSETFLDDPVCFNRVRGMLGFTGSYQGKPVSIMGSGMGVPTISIYVNELVAEYGVKTIIRVGTCGAIQEDLKIGDVIMAMTSSTNSNVNRIRFDGLDYAPAADFGLLLAAYKTAEKKGIPVRVGGVFTGDTFYGDNPDWWKVWANYGVLACDMETSALYTLGAKFGIRTLSIMTVSDNVITGEDAPAEERERNYTQMAEIALDLV